MAKTTAKLQMLVPATVYLSLFSCFQKAFSSLATKLDCNKTSRPVLADQCWRRAGAAPENRSLHPKTGRLTHRYTSLIAADPNGPPTGVVFAIVFWPFATVKTTVCGLRYSSVNHREVGVSRSDLRGAQGQAVHTWPLRSRWLGPEVYAC